MAEEPTEREWLEGLTRDARDAEEYTPTMAEVLAAATYRIAGTLSEPEWSQAHAAMDRALSAHDAQVRAEVWDEGYQQGCRDGSEREQQMQMRDWWGEQTTTPNPYRAAETEAGR